MLELLYKIIILPLVYIYEIIFGLSRRLSIKFLGEGKTPIELFSCIVIISIIVNLLTLPFYMAADQVKLKENIKQKGMKPVVDHIKKTFKGDERFMVLNAYYRLEGYNPIYSLRAAIPLLLQIPFFTAAYIFFVNVPAFNGTPLFFLPIVSDLSKPDGMIKTFSVNINLLPIIMTIINLISSFIYTKGLSIKDKLQPVALAIIFLILLYDSPSALVIYWTFNNIFSLFKTIFLKILNIDVESDNVIKNEQVSEYIDKRYLLAICSIICIFLTLSLLIPTNIIVASPQEFIINNKLPYSIILNTLIVFLGLSLWILFYYVLSSSILKKIFPILFFTISLYCLLNYFIYNNYGIITENLVYTEGFKRFTLDDVKKDLILVFCCIIIFVLLYKSEKLRYYAAKCSILIAISIFLFSLMNIFTISTSLSNILSKSANENYEKKVVYDGKLKLSKKGKNVIVLMLDKSCGKYVDYVFSDMPELKNIYDGFVFYDNVVSCSSVTLLGSTPLFGGYEYLPQNANKRDDILLVDKHNNALSIMPYNFLNNGYDCIVANLPYENFEDRNKEPLFNNIKNLTKIDLTTDIDKYIYGYGIDINKSYEDLKRKFFIYSIMRISPRTFQGVLYDRGIYLQNSEFKSIHSVRSFCAFNNMIDKCNVVDDGSNNFWMIDNELTHNHDNVIYPYGVFSPFATNSDASKYPIIVNSKGESFNGQYAQLSTEFAAYMQVGKFLEFLKENDIYDNTRIVIVSDHGCHHDVDLDKSYDINLGNNIVVPTIAFNCVLLFKDFNMKGEMSINHSFMSNADTPLLAMQDILRPFDPLLSKEINNKNRKIDSIDIYYPKDATVINYLNDYVFDSYQFSCRPLNIFDESSWYVREKGDGND